MGLSKKEEVEARELCREPRIWWESVRPERNVSLPAFWISTAPVTNEQVRRVCPGLVVGPDGNRVARLEWDDAARVARALSGRLPTEIEWEYACRGGSDGLFTFGPLPALAKIAPWMSWEGDSETRNGFGLRTLFTGEWCGDTWRESYFDEGTGVDGVHVLRGGAAYFWPWQDEEWVWCMSVTRSPSTELPEARWSFRVVLNDDR